MRHFAIPIFLIIQTYNTRRNGEDLQLTKYGKQFGFVAGQRFFISYPFHANS